VRRRQPTAAPEDHVARELLVTAARDDRHAVARSELRERGADVRAGSDRVAVDRDDDVAHFESGGRRSGTRGDGRDASFALAAEADAEERAVLLGLRRHRNETAERGGAGARRLERDAIEAGVLRDRQTGGCENRDHGGPSA
jgi:hypothetical protein